MPRLAYGQPVEITCSTTNGRPAPRLSWSAVARTGGAQGLFEQSPVDGGGLKLRIAHFHLENQGAVLHCYCTRTTYNIQHCTAVLCKCVRISLNRRVRVPRRESLRRQ